jgi:hypothetical protein
MKKIFYFFVLIVVLISFASCKADSGTNAKVDDNAAVAEIDTTMPEPFDKQSEESGGDEREQYFALCNEVLTSISNEFIQEVGADNFDKWLKELPNVDETPTSLLNTPNLYSFIMKFNVNDEKIRAVLEKEMEFYKESNIPGAYTQEGIEILLSRDESKIMEHFASEYSIVNNGKIYSPQWIYTHTIQAYEVEEIPPELIEEKMELYKDIPFSSKALDALEKKLNSYLQMDLTFDKDAKKTKEETSSSETSPAQTASTDAASSETHNETSVTD